MLRYKAQSLSLTLVVTAARRNCSAVYPGILREFLTLKANRDQSQFLLQVNELFENPEHNRRIPQVFECSPFQIPKVRNLLCKIPWPSCSLRCSGLHQDWRKTHIQCKVFPLKQWAIRVIKEVLVNSQSDDYLRLYLVYFAMLPAFSSTPLLPSHFGNPASYPFLSRHSPTLLPLFYRVIPLTLCLTHHICNCQGWIVLRTLRNGASLLSLAPGPSMLPLGCTCHLQENDFFSLRSFLTYVRWLAFCVPMHASTEKSRSL